MQPNYTRTPKALDRRQAADLTEQTLKAEGRWEEHIEQQYRDAADAWLFGPGPRKSNYTGD